MSNVIFELVLQNGIEYKFKSDEFKLPLSNEKAITILLKSINIDQKINMGDSFVEFSYLVEHTRTILSDKVYNKDIFSFNFEYGNFKFIFENKTYKGKGPVPDGRKIILNGKRIPNLDSFNFKADSSSSVGKLSNVYSILLEQKELV